MHDCPLGLFSSDHSWSCDLELSLFLALSSQVLILPQGLSSLLFSKPFSSPFPIPSSELIYP